MWATKQGEEEEEAARPTGLNQGPEKLRWAGGIWKEEKEE